MAAPPHAPTTYDRVVVVIPALNEERSLPLVLDELPPVGAVIVADNGSTDRTAEVARAGGARVVAAPRRGYGSACLAGIAAARALDPEVLVILDGDHSDHPGELSLLVDPVLGGEADLVLGDRTRRADPGSLTAQQRWGNRLATALIARRCGHRYRDMGPFRAVRFSSLEALEMEDPTWGWNVEMQLKAVQRGLRVLEVPVRYRPRIGTSKISGTVSGVARAGVKILWAVHRYAE
jgi:glycosyltransferase involved in cell wall biosynthesis